MHVTLIYPSMGGRVRAVQMEPLTMAALAGSAPPDVTVSFYDDRLEDIPHSQPTDLAAISVQTFTAKRAYEIAAAFRRRKVPVVIGGFHVAAMPQEVAEHADAIVIGEAEELWPSIIDDARAGRLQKVYKMTRRPSLEGLKYRRDIFNGKRYVPLSLVEFGRGCPYSCGFCSVGTYFGNRKICRPIDEVVEEIRHLPRRNVQFVDDNLIGDPLRAKELFRALIPLKIRWIAQAGVEIAFDDDLLRLAAASGCFGLLIGFESLSEESLRQMKKSSVASPASYEEAVAKIHGRGIRICASFLFGYDHDTLATFQSTLEFANEKKFLLTLFNHLTPFPATALYEDLRRQQRLLYERWWLEEGFRWGDPVFEPTHFTPADLSAQCRRTRVDFYNFHNILRRVLLPANRRSVLTSLALNFLIRKDIFEKHGFPLGRESWQSGNSR